MKPINHIAAYDLKLWAESLNRAWQPFKGNAALVEGHIQTEDLGVGGEGCITWYQTTCTYTQGLHMYHLVDTSTTSNHVHVQTYRLD